MMTTVFQRLQHVDYVLPYLITTIATQTSKRSSFLRCVTMKILPYKRDILDSYTQAIKVLECSYAQAIKGEHSSKKTDILIHIPHTACWLLLKPGLMPCLVINFQSPIITNMASVLKLSVIFVFMETHQRSMT